jgi:glycosyltransferase
VPTISVITVCFNSAATIVDTLRSVAAQTHAEVEHIVVDGASSDDTLRLVRTHGAHVATLISEPDLGIYDAMNKGLAAATGEFVGFLNADDLFASPRSLQLLAEALAADDADMAYGDLVYVRADDTGVVVRLWRSGRFGRSRLRFGWMPPHPTFYARRSLLVQHGGFNILLRIAADYDLMLRCLCASGQRVSYVPEVLVRMRLGGASNRSLKALWRKSREDLGALRHSGVGGVGSLLCKNLRKLPQFLLPARRH